MRPAEIVGRWHIHTPSDHALLDSMDCRFQHMHSGQTLVLAGDDIPWREVMVGAFEHLLGGCHVLICLRSVAPVLLGDLPSS